MSTVRQHLGLLWLMRQSAEGREFINDKRWTMQVSLFVSTHLDELIALAGGADIEEWARTEFTEVPAEFPQATQSPVSAAKPVDSVALYLAAQKALMPSSGATP